MDHRQYPDGRAHRIVALRILVAEVAEGRFQLRDVAWLEADAEPKGTEHRVGSCFDQLLAGGGRDGGPRWVVDQDSPGRSGRVAGPQLRSALLDL